MKQDKTFNTIALFTLACAIGMVWIYFFTEPEPEPNLTPIPQYKTENLIQEKAPSNAQSSEEAPQQAQAANKIKQNPEIKTSKNNWKLVKSTTESYHISSQTQNKKESSSKIIVSDASKTPDISKKPEAPKTAESPNKKPDTAKPSSNFPMNINTASREDLMQVKGIGEKKADAVLGFLADRGGISDMNELLDVKGIGEKTLENMLELFYAE